MSLIILFLLVDVVKGDIKIFSILDGLQHDSNEFSRGYRYTMGISAYTVRLTRFLIINSNLKFYKHSKIIQIHYIICHSNFDSHFIWYIRATSL
jgi:hypothetical protein